MVQSVYDLKAFYNSKMGRVVRRILQERIQRFWPEMHGQRLLGSGYALPFMRAYKHDVERMVAMIPPRYGGVHWPHDDKNCTFLADGGHLPIETNSIDRVLMVHHLETSAQSEQSLQEIWRVLKSNGRALVIVPNRSGLWAHTDWSPFGHGMPYSLNQLCQKLQNNMFIYERSEEALFMPPMKLSGILKSAGLFENIGSRFLPIAAGVHMVEVSKQLYAKPDIGPGTAVHAKIPGILMPKPKPATSSRSSRKKN